MGLRKYIVGVAIFFLAFFGSFGSAVAADLDAVLDVDIVTDKESYEYEDEITSTITISNLSSRYYAENLMVEVLLPEEFDVLDSDVEVTDGKIIWNTESLERGDTAELTFQTKLNQAEIERLIGSTDEEGSSSSNEDESTSATDDTTETANESTDSDDSSDDSDETVIAGSSSDDEFVAPQTGDETSLTKYIILFVLSVALGLFAFIVLRKKRLAKAATLILVVSLIAPTAPAYAESGSEGQSIQDLTKNYQFVIGDETYDAEISITATIQDGQVEIPVTGTAYNANEELLINQELTLETTVNDEIIVEQVETDEEGYFVSRLIKDATYRVTGDGLDSTLVAEDMNEVNVTNDNGLIELGKTLRNGDNYSSLQPSVIYLGDEEAERVGSIATDLTTATTDSALDIKVGDIFVVPQWDGYPTGLALYVESISQDNGQLTLQITQPELEDVFFEIHGDFHVEITPEHFIPAEGVEVIDEDDGDTPPQAQLFSESSDVGPRLMVEQEETQTSLLRSSTLSVPRLNQSISVGVSNDNGNSFSIDGTLGFGGYVDADIDYRLGLNPVEQLQFDFVGDYQLDLEVAAGMSTDLIEKRIGRLTVPTPIPALTVNVPIDFVTSLEGKLSAGFATGANFHFGLEYMHGSTPRTYPEQHFTPYFTTTDVNGSANLSAGLKFSGLAGLLGMDGFGVSATGAVGVGATTSIIGSSSFQCLDLKTDFNASAAFEAPLFNDWSRDIGGGIGVPLYSDMFGDCIESIEINPSEIEIAPGETKSVTVTADDITDNINIADDPNFHFEIADESQIDVAINEHANRVDIIASEQAQNGSVIEVTGVYDQHGTILTDTLTVKIVDDRPKGELIGQVVDAISDTAIEGAVVRVLDGDDQVAHSYTANDGVYHAMLVPGTYIVEVSHDGYITDTSRLEIREGDTTTYDAKLQLVDNEHSGIGTVTGQIQNAVTGNGIAGVTMEIRSGRNNTEGEVHETLTTDENGYYEVELPGGNYTMSLVAEYYIPSTANILAIGGERTDNQNATMSPDGVIDENLRIVLTWGERPWDIDSHLTGPTAAGERFHIYYANREFQDDFNDVNLDRDDVWSYGPETVTIIEQMQMGTYVYAVHNYTGRRLNEDNQFDLANSQAKVEVYQEDTLINTFHVPVNQAGNSWRVFEIRDGQIVPINQVETIDTWRSASDFAPLGQ